MQTVSGHVTSVGRDTAVITDSIVELRLPLVAPIDIALTEHGGETNSVTLTWPDGRSAFILLRPARPT